MTCQLAMQHIDIVHLPRPQTAVQHYLLSVDLSKGSIRPRRLDFLVSEADAQSIARLRKSGRLDTHFAVELTNRRLGFMPVEAVRFDLVGEPGWPTYAIAQVNRLVKFDL